MGVEGYLYQLEFRLDVTAWDPHQSYLQEKLEKVQRMVARFITQTTTMHQAVLQL
jgi:hypothetical protein